jgi:ATP-dependent Clp protease ATP-binding subunit ClpA
MAKERAGALKKKFKPEFLNRVDEIIHFSTLGRDEYMHILDLLLGEVQEQIKKSRSINLQFNPGAKNYLLDNGIDKKFGARPMRRAIKKHLNTPLARAILLKEILDQSKVTVSLKPSRDGLCFRTETKKKEPDVKL